MLYVIQSRTEKDDDGTPLFWSNKMGWVSLPDATVFTEQERLSFPFIPAQSSWEPAL